MHNLINAFPLYKFLKYCNKSSLEKIILDCGAGGSNPPLTLFKEFGYKTYGIEISEEQLEKAKSFCDLKNIDLNIIRGDMKKIPFSDGFSSFLFSYNTSVHMKKGDFLDAISEFYRVLRPGGLCYVNFLSKDCQTYGKGIKVGNGEYIQTEDNKEVSYSHYSEMEAEQNFSGFEIIYKEKRIIQRRINEEEYTSGYLDYILLKK